MNALTICQPYASLIVGWPGIDLAAVKRVENRTWYTSYRGPLLIHAGQSRKFLKTWSGPVPADMPTGAIVGAVEVVDCLAIDSIRNFPNDCPDAWLKKHDHALGPYCWILRRPRRIVEPIECCGRLGIFHVPDEVLQSAEWEPQCRQCGCTELDACPGGCRWSATEKDLCSNCEGK